MSMSDVIFAWAPTQNPNGQMNQAGERHYFTSLAGHNHNVIGALTPADESAADSNSQIAFPIERWLRSFRLKVPPDAPYGASGLQPGNTSTNDVTVSFRVNGAPLRTITIDGGATGELMDLDPTSPNIAAGSLLNCQTDINLLGGTPAERIVISVILARLGPSPLSFLTFEPWIILMILQLLSREYRRSVDELEQLIALLRDTGQLGSISGKPLFGLAPSGTLRDTDLMMWKVGTCDCMMAVNKKWTELRFLRPCKYHESLHTSEKDVHAEHKETNRKSVDNPKVLEEFMKKVKGFNMGKIS